MPLVLLTGYGLLFGIYGGFAGAPWPVHVMHLLGLIMAGVFVAIVLGPFRAMRAADAAPSTMTAAAARVRPLVLVNLALGVLTILIAAIARW